MPKRPSLKTPYTHAAPNRAAAAAVQQSHTRPLPVDEDPEEVTSAADSVGVPALLVDLLTMVAAMLTNQVHPVTGLIIMSSVVNDRHG